MVCVYKPCLRGRGQPHEGRQLETRVPKAEQKKHVKSGAASSRVDQNRFMSGLKMQNTGHNQRRAEEIKRRSYMIRMSDADRRKLDALKEKTGWSGAKIISTLLQETEPDELKNHVRVSADPDTDALADAFEGLRSELRRIGVNVNQVAYVANRDNTVSGHGLEIIRRSVQEIREIMDTAMRFYETNKIESHGSH